MWPFLLLGAVTIVVVVAIGGAAVFVYQERDRFLPSSGPATQARPTGTPFLTGAPLTLADDAGPLIRAQGTTVMHTEPFVREAGGRWQRVPIELRVDNQRRLSFQGGLSNPRVRIYGTAEREEDHSWVLSFVQEADEDLIGTEFGLRFRFDLASPVFEGLPTRPRVEGNAGWLWQTSNHTYYHCVVTANAVQAEEPEPGVIDLVLSPGRIPADAATAIVRVRAPMPDGLATPNAERRGPVEASAWPGGLIDHDAAPVDLRFLNHAPAGSKGFVQVADGRLVFEDGTPARFWGTNIAAYTLFLDNETIDRHAERIARMGYNLVRMHHHDSMRWVTPTVIDQSREDSRHLDLEAMDRFDYWVAALKRHGVYVWLDLHTGRNFLPGDQLDLPGGIPGFSEIAAQEGYATALNYLNPGIQALMAEFNENFLWHKNPYTGNAYADEPAVAGIAITNENNITGPLANRLLEGRGRPVHAALLAQRLAEFATHTGRPERVFMDWWGPGMGKLFLNEVEAAFNREVLDQLEALGVRVPVITTQYWSPGVQSSSWALPALAMGDAIAVHSYGQTGFLEHNPVHASNFVLDIAGGRVAGKPLVITEWGLDHRPPDRAAAPLYLAGVAALQGWDGVTVYNYTQHAFATRDTPGDWATMHDPAALALAPAAALLFRRGDLSTPDAAALLELTEQDLVGGVDATTDGALRQLAERMPVAMGLPALPLLEWHAPSPDTPDATRVQPGSSTLPEAVTTALARDWEHGRLAIDTPRSQIVAGWLGGADIATADATFAIDTPFAAIAVSSLTDAPIADSGEVLVSVAGRAVLGPGGLPFRSEPIAGDITLNLIGTASDWQCFPLRGDGGALAPLPLRQRDDGIVLPLPAGGFTHWYRLVHEPSAR